MSNCRVLCIAASVLLGPLIAAGTGAAALKIDGNQVQVGRLVFTVGANALPEQVVIRPDPWDLPLESRKADAKLTDDDLVSIGRGPQLRTPMRIEASVAGNPIVLAAVEPAALELKNEAVTCRARLSSGGVNATVESVYTRDGALDVKLTYGGGAKVDSLCVVMELSGLVDTVVSGAAPFKAADYSLGTDEGIAWGNAAPAPGGAATPANRGAPGVPAHLFYGSGDRGFTWLCESTDGWTIVPSAPTLTLTRGKGGSVAWRAWLVNHPSELRGDKTVAFELLVHPAVSKDAAHRKFCWLDWPFPDRAAQTPPLAPRGRQTPAGLLRADVATVYESSASAASLEGPGGGNADSPARTLADTYPLALFRYLSVHHTGLPARLLANSPKLIRSGMDPACDRSALGRALLHDIGVAPAGVAHLAMLARLVTALAEFGFFEPDGNTEFIPYWRSQRYVRYGESFDKDSAFEETTTNPMERIYVSIWRRPVTERETRALMVIVNEGDRPVREQLYVLDPGRLFGGPNGLTREDVVRQWDTSRIPEDSDWAGSKLLREKPQATDPNLKRGGCFLLDVEDLGGVPQTAAKDGIEVYGRTFVPAKGFRLLLGSAAVPKARAK